MAQDPRTAGAEVGCGKRQRFRMQRFAEDGGDVLGDFEPRGMARIDAVVETLGRSGSQKVGRCARDVVGVGR